MSKYNIYEISLNVHLNVNYVDYGIFGKKKLKTARSEYKTLKFPVGERVMQEQEIHSFLKEIEDDMGVKSWDVVIKDKIGYYDWSSEKSFDKDEPYTVTFSQFVAKEVPLGSKTIDYWRKELNARGFITIVEQEKVSVRESLEDM